MLDKYHVIFSIKTREKLKECANLRLYTIVFDSRVLLISDEKDLALAMGI